MMHEIHGKPIQVLVLDTPDRHHHYQCLFENTSFQIHSIDQYSFDESTHAQIINDIDVAICSGEYDARVAIQIQLLKQWQIPCVHVMDGILDWKNMWENPRSFPENQGPPIYEPLLSDYVICTGQWQAEILKALGTQGVCLPTGLPRLDIYQEFVRKTPENTRNPKVLITTANTLGFTQEHIDLTLAGLLKLRKVAEEVFGVDHIIWRIHPIYAEKLTLDSSNVQSFSKPIHEALAEINLLISTPSTVILEGMLAGTSVCQVDFTNSPCMTQTVWMIQHSAQIESTLHSMRRPTNHHIKFQAVLRDHQLAAPGNSSNLLIDLIDYITQPNENLRSITPSLLTQFPILEQSCFNAENKINQQETELLNIQCLRILEENNRLRRRPDVKIFHYLAKLLNRKK